MFFKYTADAYAYALMPGESGEHLRHLPQPGQVRQEGPLLPKKTAEGEVPQEEGAQWMCGFSCSAERVHRAL